MIFWQIVSENYPHFKIIGLRTVDMIDWFSFITHLSLHLSPNQCKCHLRVEIDERIVDPYHELNVNNHTKFRYVEPVLTVFLWAILD